jgi:hypothetical protein
MRIPAQVGQRFRPHVSRCLMSAAPCYDFADSNQDFGIRAQNSGALTRGPPDLAVAKIYLVLMRHPMWLVMGRHVSARPLAGRTASGIGTGGWWKAVAPRANVWLSARRSTPARSTTVSERPGANRSPHKPYACHDRLLAHKNVVPALGLQNPGLNPRSWVGSHDPGNGGRITPVF